jgi:iron(III) transport system substrate-binding protein
LSCRHATEKLAPDKPELRRKSLGDDGRVVVVPPEDGVGRFQSAIMHGTPEQIEAAVLSIILKIAARSLPFLSLAILIPLGIRAKRSGYRQGEQIISRLTFVCCALFLGGAVLWLSGCSKRSASSDSVILYCAQDQIFAEPILAEFTKQTGIAVKPVFDSEAVKTVGLANRLLAERNHPVCDVFWGNEEFRTRQLAAAGVFRATNGWIAFGRRSRRLVVRRDRFAEVFSNQYSVSQSPRPLNTDALITDHLPLSSLTNAAFHGRVSLALPLFGTTATHFISLRQHWGESNWCAWCRALAANRPFLEEGNSHVVKRVVRGEALIGLTDSDDITAAQREGLPVTALPIFPESLLIPNTLGLVAKAKPNPAAEKLCEFLQSPAVHKQLIAAAALEPETPATNTLRPDWPVLLRDLNHATDQLKEVFRR